MRKIHEEAEDKQLEAAIIIATSVLMVGNDLYSVVDCVGIAETLVEVLRKRGHLALVVGRREP